MRTSTAGKRVNRLTLEGGFTYIVVLVALIVIGIMAEAASSTTYVTNQREREQQLLFNGMAYYKAIRQFYTINGHYPRTLEELMKDPGSAHRVFIRALYPDPMKGLNNYRENGGWRILRATDGGISGVASFSRKEPLKKTNFPLGFEKFEDASSYSEWEFEYLPKNVVTK